MIHVSPTQKLGIQVMMTAMMLMIMMMTMTMMTMTMMMVSVVVSSGVWSSVPCEVLVLLWVVVAVVLL